MSMISIASGCLFLDFVFLSFSSSVSYVLQIRIFNLELNLQQVLLDGDTVRHEWARDILIRQSPRRLDADFRLAQCSAMQMCCNIMTSRVL